MIEIPQGSLPEETLNAVIESFILRDGTDYGEHEVSLSKKIAQVRKQIESGKVVLVYDEELETCNLLRREDFLRLEG